MPRSLTHALLVTVALSACESSAPVRGALEVTIEARTATGDPVAGARAWAAGRALGETDAAGHLRTKLEGTVGERVALSWACPAAYATRSEQRTLVLEPAAAHIATPTTLRAQCDPLERLAALVVRVNGAPPSGVPVRVRGEVVARTDEAGVAHALLRVRPNAPLAVALDTSAYPELLPRDPVETFQLGGEDSVLLLERTLTSTPPTPPKERRRVRREPARRLPYRIH
jgi:hypothetical protein